MMGTGQLNIALGVGQGLMSQPLLQDRQRDPLEDAVAEGVGSGGSIPAAATARFIGSISVRGRIVR